MTAASRYDRRCGIELAISGDDSKHALHAGCVVILYITPEQPSPRLVCTRTAQAQSVSHSCNCHLSVLTMHRFVLEPRQFQQCQLHKAFAD